MAENSWSLGRALRGMFVKPTIDENTWEDLETALLTADFAQEFERYSRRLQVICRPDLREALRRRWRDVKAIVVS